MTVKVLTDSVSDMPPQVAHELGITVVPVTVAFGTEAYLDGVEITADEFYPRVVKSPIWPTTAAPSIGQFLEAYNKLAEETDEIIAIFVSAKLTPVCENALKAKDLVEKECRIEVIDSQWATGSLGLIAITAAKAAQAGANLDEVVEVARQAIPKTHMLMFFDTLKYLEKSGRIGKARALMGSVLRIKPLITFKDGVLEPVGRVRTRREGLERLYKFATSFPNISEMVIAHANIPEEAEKLAQRIDPVFPRSRIYMSRVSPVVGTHLGPGTIVLAVLEG